MVSVCLNEQLRHKTNPLLHNNIAQENVLLSSLTTYVINFGALSFNYFSEYSMSCTLF